MNDSKPLRVKYDVAGEPYDVCLIGCGVYEYWVRPEESLRPQDAQQVEGGCYW